MSSQIVRGLFLAMTIGALAGCNSSCSGTHHKLGGASDSPVHVQGGSIKLICCHGWNPVGSGLACDATDTSKVTFQDDNSGHPPSSPTVNGPWTITVHAKDNSLGVKLCTIHDGSSRCDSEGGTGRGNFVMATVFGGRLKKINDNRYELSCSNDSDDPCAMASSDFNDARNSHPCRQSKGCWVGIGPTQIK